MKSETLKVSVVIPTYRRPELLRRCLTGIAQQSLDSQNFEVIVADDGPDAETREAVLSFQGNVSFSIHYIPVAATQGPAGARNAGWKSARAELIAFTDDDTVPEGDWLEEGLKAFEGGTVAAAWGRIEVPLPADPTDYERDAAGLSRAEFATANSFCRRSILEQVGGFDERFTAAWREDSDLHFSILKHLQSSQSTHQVVRIPQAVVVHPIRPAAWGVSIQQQKKSLFNALLYKKHPALYAERIQARPPWLYYGILLSALVLGGSVLLSVKTLAWMALLLWMVLTGLFLHRRLRNTSARFDHVCEMIFTSVIIPWLSVYWRLRGAWRFRVLFF